MGIPALLSQLFRARKTGILSVRRGEITKYVFVNGAMVLKEGLATSARPGHALR